MRNLLFLLFFLGFSFQGIAQHDVLANTQITVHWQKATLVEVLEDISQKTSLSFTYSKSFIPNKTITLAEKTLNVKQLLAFIFTDTQLTYRQVGKDIIISPQRKNSESTTLKLAINGRVLDAETKEELVNAFIYFQPTLANQNAGQKMGVSTNVNGYFATSLTSGEYKVQVRYLGYEFYTSFWEIESDYTYTIELTPENFTLNEVTVTETNEEIKQLEFLNNTISLLKLRTETIDEVPPFFGEADVVRSLQLLPSVQTIPEGSSGLFVRGGTEGQNLILLDGAPIYNPNHMFGLFSIFNTDVIKSVDLYNEAFPAQHGGRIASVVDVRTKDGNAEKATAKGTVGTIASHLTVEAPWAKGKGTFWIGGRFTYIDLLMKLFAVDLPTADRFYFYDINMKATLKGKKLGKVSLSAYLGNDNSGLGDLTRYTWGNEAYSLRWSKALGKKGFSETTLFYSNFENTANVTVVESQGYRQGYNLSDIGIKQHFSLFPSNKIMLEGGIESIYHSYNLGSIEPLDSLSTIIPEGTPPTYALESAAFAEVEYSVLQRLKARMGLRLSRFDLIGPGLQYRYNVENVVSPETSEANIVFAETFEDGEIYDRQFGLEPRLSLSYTLSASNAVKVTYTRMRQYVHLLSNQGIVPPLTFWLPSNRYIDAQFADLFSLGYFRKKRNGLFQLSLQGYYRITRNQIDFKPSANLFLNDHIETEVLSGRSRTYGIELLAVKEKGKLTGTFSYTYANSQQEIEGINNGEEYPSSSDRRHNLSLLLTQKFNSRLSLSANWMFASGVAFSFPAGRYEKDGFILPYYTARNSFRLPATHRLDLSLIVKKKSKATSKIKEEFNFSIYNFYGRKNPYSYIFRQSEVDPAQTEVIKLFLFTVLPSITYRFQF